MAQPPFCKIEVKENVNMKNVSDISLHETSDISLHETSDFSLHETSDISLHETSDISLHETSETGVDASLVANNNNNAPTTLTDDDVNEDANVENAEEERDVPIDKGWAWVIVGACFGMHVLVLGGVKSFGVLFVELRDTYHVTARELGMIQGIAMTLMLGLGLAANILAVRFTCQKVVFLGGILSAAGFVLSAFIPSFDLLYITYSVITGLGFALSYSPCVVMVGIHFQKRRSLANGISLSGSGVGSFIFPIIIRWMLNEYGLSGCFLLLGGLMLNVCACALLFRPVSSYPRKRSIVRKYHNGKDTDLQHLMDLGDGKAARITDEVCSHLQEKDHHTQDGSTGDTHQLKSYAWKKDVSQFSSSEYIPMASLQSIPQEEIQKMADSVCARFKCFISKNRGRRQGPKLFNWSLLSNPLFLIYASSCALGNFAYPNIFLMLPAYAESNGQDRDTAALLVSVIGITDLIGRLFFGWFADLRLMPRRYGFVGCMALSAVLNLAAPLMTTFVAMVTYASLYGLFAGSYMALISVMLADALGVEKLSSAYGLVLLMMSLGLLPGPLICGGIRDVTLKWDYSFVLCGLLALVGSIPPLFEPCAKRHLDAKEERKHQRMKSTKDV